MPKFAANLTMLYNEYPFLDRFAAARADGFAAVEFLFPYAYPKEQIAETLQQNLLKQVLHNLPAGNWEAGERGIACLPDRTGEFQEGVGRAIEYATALACPQVNCLTGIAPPGADPDRVRATLVENLKFAADKLEAAGIRLLIEPINDKDIPGFWLNYADQAVALVDELGSRNVFVQYDLYHQQRMSGELAATFRRLKDRIAHIQVADNPGRNEPGTGEINYPFLFDQLDCDRYIGWIGCEYKPKTTTSAGLGWAAAYLRRGSDVPQQGVST
ncbi:MULTISPECIES: hydroxypyruvate isomerase [unclassified Bradyrhizobium]|uniref:hydroxypyruvate isomerase n=1 Tax=unclassified Bradyrhizobium TaxID=2631580 RepID=UPI002479F479|nr:MULTISPECIES: hydroxypyruvate isomerase [unclassified Bradyrhizobium]WGR75221.1 hydroxypyruvate isomerase [Bradyrhizobium sp. ISRA426]WGR82722.1 hydroxypyruvate isomerase [Bradyrhizobium sp. ISRA430]WGR90420.1 hydroxypyruvate isomerase [Bradyrhizobium sp. ISRA432]